MEANITMPYTDDEIKAKVERDSSCTFISTEMRPVKNSKSTRRWLKLSCNCGNIFEADWGHFNSKRNPKKQCLACGNKIRASHHVKSIETYLTDERYKKSQVEYVEGFVGFTKTCLHKCPKCLRTDWKVSPGSILKGVEMCSKCQMGTISGWNKQDDKWYQTQKRALGISIVNIEPYITADTKIKHLCTVCGCETLKTPGNVLSQRQVTCESCSYELRGKNQALDKQKLSKKLANFRCQYVSGEITGKYSVVTFQCQCGNLFKKPIASVLSKGLDRCKTCASSESEGELCIREWLTANNFEFTPQQKFEDLRGVRNMPLSYDFGVYKSGKLHTLIEYDGEHHFKPVNYGGEGDTSAEIRLKRVRERDSRKTEYAKENGYKLIRLSGTQHKNLDSILKPLLSKC